MFQGCLHQTAQVPGLQGPVGSLWSILLRSWLCAERGRHTACMEYAMDHTGQQPAAGKCNQTNWQHDDEPKPLNLLCCMTRAGPEQYAQQAKSRHRNIDEGTTCKTARTPKGKLRRHARRVCSLRVTVSKHQHHLHMLHRGNYYRKVLSVKHLTDARQALKRMHGGIEYALTHALELVL